MRFACDACGAQYMIADEKVGPRGVKVKCKKCGHIIVVKPAAEGAASSEVDTGSMAAPAAQGGETPAPSAMAGAAAGGELGSAFGGTSTEPAAGLGGFDDQDKTAITTSPLFGGNGQGAAASSPPPQEAPAVNSGADAGGAVGGAFDSLFGDSPFGGADDPAGDAGGTAFGGTAAPSQDSPDSGHTRAEPGPKEWYVAIDDSQVGPVDIAEIEQRWKGKEITEDSLAWKAGMSDWAPVGDIPELSYLLTELPHTAPAATPASLGGGAAGLPSTVSSASVSPATFGGGAPAAETVAWKPSAASALSSLVQEELVTPPEEEAPAAPSPSFGMDMPSFGGGAGGGAAGGLFGGDAAKASDGFSAPLPAAPAFGGGDAAGWSMPAGPPKSGSSHKGLYIMVGIFGLVVVGGVGALAYILLNRPPQVIAQVDPAKVESGGGSGSGSEAKGEKAAPSSNEEKPKDPAPARTEKPSTTKARPAKTTAAPPPPREKPRREEDIIDPSDSGSSSGPVKASLDANDIINGVKQNGRSVAPCLQAARSAGEIVPGQYKFILDWTIRPNGSVADPELKGPSSVLGTSLPRCFAREMRKWKFPASKKATPVKNFPFGPVRVP